MKSIYEYASYRKFLADFYRERKDRDSKYSYAVFAREANLGSPNYLKLMIDGKRNLTINNIHHFAIAAGLTSHEVDYFEALVLKNQSIDSLEEKFYQRRLTRLKNDFVVNKPNSFSKVKNFSRLADLQRSMCLLLSSKKTCEDAIGKISQELNIPIAQASAMIQSLIGDESLSIQDGVLVLPEKNMMIVDSKGRNEKQRIFLLSGLKEAEKVFDERYPIQPAKFLSLLLTAREGALLELFEQMRQLTEKVAIQNEPHSNDSIGVYRLQFQVYRIMRAEE